MFSTLLPRAVLCLTQAKEDFFVSEEGWETIIDSNALDSNIGGLHTPPSHGGESKLLLSPSILENHRK